MNDLFLRACRREPVPRTPVWFMRQAGRYQREYRYLRSRYELLDICRTPELAAEVTLLPVQQLGVDAAILFSDIMVPIAAMGVDVRIEEGRGPVIDEPIRSEQDVRRLPVLDHAEVGFVEEAIRLIVNEEIEVPLIGFCGGPFTLASYLIEGVPSRTFTRTKALMFGAPAAWEALMTVLADSMTEYLRLQLKAGVAAVQVFDSWAGALGPDDYAVHVLPYAQRIFSGLSDFPVPLIHFGVGSGSIIELMRDAHADVMGLDWRVDLDEAWERLGPSVAVQGNLDPAALLAPWEVVERKTLRILAQAAGRPGHVFNLGHGVLPETDPGVLRRVVDLVHERTEQS